MKVALLQVNVGSGSTLLRIGVLSSTMLLAAARMTLTLPDIRLTPGAVDPVGSTAVVCVPGYARAHRHRYDAEWRRYRTAIFREYGIPHERWRLYTIDHLVPIELGGRPFGVIGTDMSRPTWDLSNVWPEPKAEALQKDAVENALHAAVCYSDGYKGVHLTLNEAAQAIARDWTRTPVALPPLEDRPNN